MKISRHLRAVWALPFVGVVFIPSALLFLTGDFDSRWDPLHPAFCVLFFLGMIFTLAGMFLFSVTVYLFKTLGRGPLAPETPPRS